MRLPEDHAYRQLTAPEARASIASELGLEITDIPRALPVKTGWARSGKECCDTLISYPRPCTYVVAKDIPTFSFVQ